MMVYTALEGLRTIVINLTNFYIIGFSLSNGITYRAWCARISSPASSISPHDPSVSHMCFFI